MPEPDPAAAAPGPRRRMAVVSLHAHRPLAPRGERTRRLLERLRRDWDVEIVAPPPSVATGGAEGSGRSNPLRRAAARGVSTVLLDKWEPWSAKTFLRWRPECDAALLIGHPYSPLVYAGRRLHKEGVPYVVDVGDPWVLTAPDRELVGLAEWRARRAELRLWRDCAGAVLTTEGQAEALTAAVPGLATLVRPAGYDELPAAATQAGRGGEEATLRLAHFGMLNNQRLDPRPLLVALARSGRWRRLHLTQFGDDFVGFLDRLPDGWELERRSVIPWPQVLAEAPTFDAAVVIGNRNRTQLPSKAVQYLTLPIPRIAIAVDGDALQTYVKDKPGWLVVDPGAAGAAELLAAHLAQPWDGERLQPPEAESWPRVADTIVEFIESRLDAARG